MLKHENERVGGHVGNLRNMEEGTVEDTTFRTPAGEGLFHKL